MQSVLDLSLNYWGYMDSNLWLVLYVRYLHVSCKGLGGEGFGNICGLCSVTVHEQSLQEMLGKARQQQ